MSPVPLRPKASGDNSGDRFGFEPAATRGRSRNLAQFVAPSGVSFGGSRIDKKAVSSSIKPDTDDVLFAMNVSSISKAPIFSRR